MFGFLTSLFRSRSGATRSKPAQVSRRARLNVEALEDRFLPSVTPIMQPVLSTARYAATTPAINVPNLQGVTFYLSTANNPYAGVVTVTSETPFSDVMKITGTWTDETAGTKNNQFSGSLGRDSFGNVWIDITDGSNVLIAKVTTVYSSYPLSQSASPYGWHYSLDGSLIPPGSVLGTHVTGYGDPPPPVNTLAY
jgi:hypothetical protein